jgi:hypothetical protein
MSLKEYKGSIKCRPLLNGIVDLLLYGYAFYFFSRGWIIKRSSLSRFIRYFSLAYFSMAEALNCRSLENFRFSAICFSKYCLDCLSSFSSPLLSIWVNTSLRSKNSIHTTKAVVASKNLFLRKEMVRPRSFILVFLRRCLEIQ